MKKMTILILVLVMVAAFPQFALAAKEDKEVSKSDKINRLVTDGIPYSDAVYYVEVDEIIKEMDRKNEKFNFSNVIPVKASKYTDEFVRTHKTEFRGNIKNRDSQAILKGLQSDMLIHENGVKDINELIKQDKKNNVKRGSYTVTYPDGSSVTLKGSTERESTDNEEVKVNGTHIPGGWNSTADINSQYNVGFVNGQPVAGNYITTTEWQFSSGVSLAKVKDVFTWKFIPQTYTECSAGICSPVIAHKVQALSDTGSSASYGVVTVDVENLPNMNSTSGTGIATLFQYIQGYTDVRFAVSGSVSAGFNSTYLGLSLSIAVNAKWHQYAISEVDGWSGVYYYAGTFK